MALMILVNASRPSGGGVGGGGGCGGGGGDPRDPPLS